MLVQGIVGVQSVSDGSTPFVRMGKQGEQSVSELHARYYEQNYRGNIFSIHTQATGVTTSAALATTFTGLAVGNAAGSGVNLVLLGFSCTQFAVGAAASIGIMGAASGANPIVATALVPASRLIGAGPASKATASAGSITISTPILIDTYGSTGSLATTGYGLEAGIYVDIGGCIIVPPGSFIASYTSIATTSALSFGYVWEEVPI